MKNVITKTILSVVAVMLCCMTQLCAQDKVTTISSVKELAEVITKSGGNIKMKPGTYQITDYLTNKVIGKTKYADSMKRKAMMLFSGSNNTFDFTGVTIEIDTKLLSQFDASINEFQIIGDNNTIKGLTITDIGNYPPTTKGARSFVVTGDNNTIDGVTLNMSGSAPLGYGDLLGKGSTKVSTLKKHSGMLIEGLNIKVLNCKIYSRSFGHLFFVQGGRNVLFENCYAESAVRSTDEMLSEKSGPAFDINFKSVYTNRDRENVITAGYMKSLSECGFRNYGTGGPEKHKTGVVTLKNCRAKNTRIGFAFTRMDKAMKIENCEAQGCEVAYYLSGVDVTESRGDAMYGPLLTLCKSEVPSNIDLELMPATSDYMMHALAIIAGENHKIKISKYNGETRSKEHPIIIGQSGPAANNGFSPMRQSEARGVELVSNTGMPIILNSSASSCSITTNDTVTDNGQSNKITK